MIRIELWKDIEGYDGIYQVSNQGRIRSRKRGEWRLLKPGHGDGRYCQVGLVKDGKRHWKRVHQLVAEAFIANPDHLPQIDHKDGNLLNNYADNLRWVSPADNTRNPNTIGHLRGNRKEQRKQREARKMIQRLERMRSNDRCIITDQYMIFFDRINDYYFLAYIKTTDSPLPFQTGDYLNEEGAIDYYRLWKDMKRVLIKKASAIIADAQ